MLTQIHSILLQTPGGGGFQLIFLIGMIAVMYFFMIRPQAKKAKEQKQFASTIDVGEHIITAAGIHGTIKRTNDDGTLLLEVHHGQFMTIERSSVSMEMTVAYRKKVDTPADLKEVKK